MGGAPPGPGPVAIIVVEHLQDFGAPSAPFEQLVVFGNQEQGEHNLLLWWQLLLWLLWEFLLWSLQVYTQI